MKKSPDAGQRLVAYYRYSGGGNQTEQSIEGQRRDCEAWAAAHGLTIQREYIDRHISGKSDNRAAFQQMIEDSDKHAFDLLICWKTDRLARNRYDSAIYKNRLRKNGVKIMYAAESSIDGPEGIILEGLMESLAEYYSAELSQKLRRGQRESALKCHGLGGNYALGLTTNKNHEFVIDEAQAPTVRFIFERYAAGDTAAAIVDALNAEGKRTSRGKPFNKNSVLRIITNEQYIGVYTSKAHGIRKEGAIPAIIDKELFDRAQARLLDNRAGRRPNSNRADYILSGKLFCGCCKSAMKGISGTGRHGDKHFYYTCPGRAKGCSKHNIEKRFLEDLIVSATVDYILAPVKLDQIADRLLEVQQAERSRPNPEREMLAAELRENTHKQENILRAIENGTGSAKLAARLQDLEQQEAALRHQLSTIEAEENGQPEFTKEQLLFMLEQFRREPDEQNDDYKRRLLDTFITQVWLTDETALVQFALNGKSSTPESVLLYLSGRGPGGDSNDDTSNPAGFDQVTFGGGDGSRTHVRKEFSVSISGCGRSTTFPPRHAGRQANALVAS